LARGELATREECSSGAYSKSFAIPCDYLSLSRGEIGYTLG